MRRSSWRGEALTASQAHPAAGDNNFWLDVAFWTLVYGTWANWGATLLAGIWGTGEITPIASDGRTGKPAHEKIVSSMLIGVGITDAIAVVIIFVGLVG
jgi:hydroxylaminobenzene mutase